MANRKGLWAEGHRTIALLLAVALSTTTAHAADNGSRVYAAQVRGGAVRVLTVLLDRPWPAGGLRIEDDHGTVLVPHVEPDRRAPLDAASERALAAMQHLPASGHVNAKAAQAVLALRLASDWHFARAAGAAAELPAGMHPHAVRVVLLQADGSVEERLAAANVTVDGGPPSPTDAHAQAAPTGVTVQWRTARQATVPVYAYSVQRAAPGERAVLTAHPQLMTLQKNGLPSPFLDRTPPVEATLTYEVRLLDVLGVASEPASAPVYSPDFEAAIPPAEQKSQSGKGDVTLTWKRIDNPRTGGLAVERAQLIDGPYEMLTPQGLSPRETSFKDEHVLGGANYYYRVRVVLANGDLGPAPDPVHAQALSAHPLAAPLGLAAQVGVDQVVLAWQPVPGAQLAGYIVERRASSNALRWTRLNTRLAPRPQYVDAVGPSSGGRFEYRVTAVASDETRSEPSEALQVALRDTVPPAAPIVLATSGADAHVQIHFTPAEPADKTAQVALLRSDSAKEDGLVVGTPVGATTGVVQDDWVQAGRTYWYRLVAFDADGNRSDATEAFEVRVGAVDLPKPKPPRVQYVEQPSPQMKLTFEAPPAHALVIVQVQREADRWQRVVGPMTGDAAVDLDPPGPHAKYRIVYVGENGGAGVASEAAEP